ncbi:tRNA (guanine-N(7)-)-methyltransferase non-catalytic subunit trm82 [Aspergillus brasiliensis]|uniref:tRNA (Guanine-N(7)-)-methyltransferase non-catalytic subunit trm82 n=1 Tax=Aspergillus brasiliensis TaxID=319629 RepID=A0A9W6DJ19_9EURO|nr:tRNA (guanine-N(7)-)-methyltransferase non-catalytic subunit trm82 [Aspergillus brasiliensis]GKZ41632.1 tRNA (guanine-N(7)-)-methyltransferase non-catalytic subunit trm82 [Aspergillus brasiliensis]
MAAHFQHPLQCLRLVQRSPANLLIGSAGSKLYSYSAETGQQLAVWPKDVASSENNPVDAESTPEQGPPEKKRKVSSSDSQTIEKPAWSNIPIVTGTANGEHIVALTAEDKCVRVFQVQEDGSFVQLSERAMPKRPSAITLTDDDSTILCGDKFGDVYSLPLIPSDKLPAVTRALRSAKLSHPAATNLTVHTKGNRRALEQQLRLASEGKKDEQSSGPTFEHKLLLGHVSLLTDMAYVSLSVDENKKRSYILTADRDEHIRVSRGLPQAHVIENYCLGHTAFVSKLCVPQWAPQYLVSGGGDNYLLVWNWAEGRILQKVSLVDEASEATEVAVQGIWATSLGDLRIILVALHGSTRLQCFTLEADGTLNAQASIQLSGNVLDLTTVEKDSTILVSVDTVRQPDSTQEWRASPSSPSTLVEAFRIKTGADRFEWEPTAVSVTDKINSTGTEEIPATVEEKQRKELNDSLYGLGHLRKRKGEDE